MEMYVDWIVGLNFLVDFLLLYGTDRLSGAGGSVKRAAAGAAVGALYAGGCLVPGFSFLANGFWRLVMFGLVAMTAFGWGKSALRRGILFFLLSMALGGIATGFGSFGAWALVLGGAGLWLLCTVGFGGGNPAASYAAVQVRCRGKQLAFTALVDTGNTLKDPVSGCPVLVADARAAGKLLGLSARQLQNPADIISRETMPGLRLIPYHGVGVPQGLMVAIRPEWITVNGKETRHILAFAPQDLGNGRFEALIGGNV